MLCTIDRLAVVRVAEVMTEEVVTIRNTDTMYSAVATIRSHRISGAPVVDNFGRCVGMLSLVDCVQTAPCGEPQNKNLWCDLVLEHMVSPVVSISPTASLVDAARMMCTNLVRRLLVVDEDAGQLVGMLSSLDVIETLVVEAN